MINKLFYVSIPSHDAYTPDYIDEVKGESAEVVAQLFADTFDIDKKYLLANCIFEIGDCE